MSVYELRPADDDWRSIDYIDDVESLQVETILTGRGSLGAIWTPINVRETKLGKPRCDYPEQIGPSPVLSLRAYEFLHSLISPCGEVLELSCKDAEYVLFHVLAGSGLLDVDRSRIDWMNRTKRIARKVNSYYFLKPCLPPIFVLPELVYNIFVTGEFVKVVEDNALLGFRFTKLSV